MRNGKEVEKIRIIPLYVPTQRREKVVRLFFLRTKMGRKATTVRLPI